MISSLSTQIILGAWLVFLVVWLVASVGAKRTRRRGWSWLFIQIAFAFLILYLIDHHSFNGFDKGIPALAPLGALFVVLGIALAIWARFYLGRNWGMPMSRRVEPELVTSGPYSYIRHPIYTGVLLAMLGSALATGLWWLILFGMFAGYFIYGASVEERHMASEFPGTYPAYKARTKMLIPFLF